MTGRSLALMALCLTGSVRLGSEPPSPAETAAMRANVDALREALSMVVMEHWEGLDHRFGTSVNALANGLSPTIRATVGNLLLRSERTPEQIKFSVCTWVPEDLEVLGFQNGVVAYGIESFFSHAKVISEESARKYFEKCAGAHEKYPAKRFGIFPRGVWILWPTPVDGRSWLSCVELRPESGSGTGGSAVTVDRIYGAEMTLLVATGSKNH